MGVLARAGVAVICLWPVMLWPAPQVGPGGSIGGVVLDQRTGAPVRKAEVTLDLFSGGTRSVGVEITGALGRFSFRGLPPGDYRLFAGKVGFASMPYGAKTPGQPGQFIKLQPGESRGDIEFRLPAMGVVAGTVTDEDGDPLSQVSIQLLRTVYQRREARLAPGPGGRTDDRGRYRIPGVPPGKWYVRAQTQGSPARYRVAGADEAETPGYGATYYPDATGLEAASVIGLTPGAEIVNVDFRLAPQSASRVSGRILGVSGEGPVQSYVTFLYRGVPEAGHSPLNMSTGARPPEFDFQLAGLVPGPYDVYAKVESGEARQYGRIRLELRPGVNENVSVRVSGGTDLPGTVVVEGDPGGLYKEFRVWLTPGDGSHWGIGDPSVDVKDKFDFTLPAVPPGVWDIGIRPIPAGGYLKATTLGGQDVLNEEMTIRDGERGPLRIVLSTRGAVVEGEVDDDFVRGGRSAAILLAPRGPYEHVLSYYQGRLTDAARRFRFIGVTPGEYRVYAFQVMQPGAFQDPEFLKPYAEFGTPIGLAESQTVKVRLPLIVNAPAPEAAP